MQELDTRHPDQERLAAFGLGRLSDEESKTIELHVASCAECRRKVEEAPADALVALLKASASDTQAPLAGALADTDPASLSKESVPPLYKRLAQIIAGKEGQAAPAAPKASSTPSVSVKAGFTAPRGLDGHARYLVLEPLGAGGMGTVYKAQHRLMERLVALKIVNPLLVNRPGAAERFEREVRAAAKLVHPNIVTAFDAEKVGDMHVLVMEFVEGQTLAELLTTQGELPVAKACTYLRQTAIGLQHALERGMVHRDIKPQNLMLTSGGEIKILDFGLARFVSEEGPAGASTEHGALMGSPDYMAPEQGQDAHSADARADIYSMGCTLYHLLAGQPPFPESSLLAKLEAQRDKQPIPLYHVRPDVPVALARVVEKMMAKDPAQRYQTPAEVAEALRPFTQADTAAPVAASPAAAPGRSAHKPLLALAIAACLVLAGAGYWLTQIVFRVETPGGTLLIQSQDPDVQISVKSGGKEVVLFFPREKKEIPLKVGAYTIELVGGKEGLKLSTQNFRIENGKGQTVTVEFMPVVARKDPPKVEEKPKSDPALPALPSMQELLETREVLTVAQDGSGRFKTIQDALDAVQSNQVILVKDKGPYRETLNKSVPSVPADVALISLVGTRIEIPKFETWLEGPEKGKFWYYGAWLNVEANFRLSGFEWTAAADRPANPLGGMLVAVNPGGDVCIEKCSFQGPDYLASLIFRTSGSQKPARRLVQENYANQWMEFHDSPGTLIVQRNFVSNPNTGLLFHQRSGTVLVRENVLFAQCGITVHHGEAEKDVLAPGVDLQIHNNVLETSFAPITFISPFKPSLVLPRSARIANNIFRSRNRLGITLWPQVREIVKERFDIGPNVYLTQPEKQPESGLEPWPASPRDLILRKHFLSVDPKDAGYLRVAANGPLAKGGAGGALPAYFGAFPPGPAPKDGDWFTRLQGVAKPLTAPAAAPKTTPESLPLQEYLKGRVILTVAQDGKAMFTTINAALDKLKPNQVIKVLDKGPYRETVNRDLPENVGLVSEVGTRIEIPEWWKSGVFEAAQHRYTGWNLQSPRNLRLHGFEFVSPSLKADAGLSITISLRADGDITLESTRILHTPRYGLTAPKIDDPAFLQIRIDISSWTDEAGRVSVRNNYMECALFIVRPGAAISVQRNHIVGWAFDGIYVWTAAKPREVVVRDNFIQGHFALRFEGRDTPPEHWADVPVSITNNVLDAVAHPIFFFTLDDAKKGWYPRKVDIHNNILRSREHRGIILTVKGLSEVKDVWRVSHNCYENEPGGVGGLAAFPKQATDLIEPAPFMSFKPGDAGFLRIAADGPLATGGAGGHLPKYIGAFPPGPAPKDGDWFTRLLALRNQTTTTIQPWVIAAPPLSLKDWLATKNKDQVLTVAQDGKAMFNTLQKALDALKPGQVIKVLDKGPYREMLASAIPDNTALVSEGGTRIEIPTWTRWGPDPTSKQKNIYQGLLLHSGRGFRLAGFEILCPVVPADAASTVALDLALSGEIIVEGCRVLHTPRFDEGTLPQEESKKEEFYALRLGLDDPGLSTRSIVRENYFEGTVDLGRGRGAADFLVERNRVVAPWHSNAIRLLNDGPGDAVLRHNVIQSRGGHGIYLRPQQAKNVAKARYLMANNVFDVFNVPLYAWAPLDQDNLVIPRAVRIRNNVVHSRAGDGFQVLAQAFAEVKDVWQVGHNSFRMKPGAPADVDAFCWPLQATDLVRKTEHFLADDRREITTYLRISAEGPLASGGAGGDLPKYIGAFPSGPAPKEGDWFTQLLKADSR